MKYKKIISILLLIAWMVMVFMFSHQGSETSSGTSGNTIRFVLEKLNITQNMNEQEKIELIDNLQPYVRKLAHFSAYTLGGILSYITVSQYNITKKRKIIIALIICVAYSITDEIHQSFIPGRSCELRDVIIDSSGALFGIALISFFKKIKSLRKI